MAIMTIKIRTGLKADLDASKLIVGEYALTTDTLELFMCFELGKVKRIATVEQLEELLNTSAETLQALESTVAVLEANEELLTSLINKLDDDGDSSNTTVTFLEDEERSNIESGSKVSLLFSKIKRWYDDLKTVAWTGSYNDLTDQPDVYLKSETYPLTSLYTKPEIDNSLALKTDKTTTAQLSNPNLLINGDFRIWQRGESSYETVNGYVADRWYHWDVVIKSMEKISTGARWTTTGTNWLIQCIEGNFLIAKNYTLSVRAKVTSGDGVVSMRVSANESPTSATNISNKSITLTSTMQTYTLTVNNVSTSKFLTVSLLTQTANVIEIEYIKLEEGTIATPNIPRLYAEELSLCQRYYEKFSTSSGLPIRYKNTTTSTQQAFQLGIFISFKVEKMVAPTTTIQYDISDGETLTIQASSTVSGWVLPASITLETGQHIDINSWIADAEI